MWIKEAHTPAYVRWHQDGAYFFLDPLEHVTAWVALSDASREAGCMEVLSFEGQPKQFHHSAARLANSINGAGQLIVEPLDETRAVPMALRAGELSLHHTLCAHRSAPNRAAHRRVGLGISYIPAHVRPTGSYRMPALLVRGSNTGGHFDVLPSPRAELDEEGIAVHERTYRRYRENYHEQEKRHEDAFARRSTAGSPASSAA
jgi:ectoine hydroxylase-related dioxygenase (phytanoyl-CoA dioxygenase family)